MLKELFRRDTAPLNRGSESSDTLEDHLKILDNHPSFEIALELCSLSRSKMMRTYLRWLNAPSKFSDSLPKLQEFQQSCLDSITAMLDATESSEAPDEVDHMRDMVINITYRIRVCTAMQNPQKNHQERINDTKAIWKKMAEDSSIDTPMQFHA